MADTAYDSDHRRHVVADKGAVAMIPNSPSGAQKYPLDKDFYAAPPYRMLFAKLKYLHRVQMFFENTARNYLAVVTIAALLLWIR